MVVITDRLPLLKVASLGEFTSVAWTITVNMYRYLPSWHPPSDSQLPWVLVVWAVYTETAPPYTGSQTWLCSQTTKRIHQISCFYIHNPQKPKVLVVVLCNSSNFVDSRSWLPTDWSFPQCVSVNMYAQPTPKALCGRVLPTIHSKITDVQQKLQTEGRLSE